MRESNGRPPISSKHLWVRSVSGASRRATPAARMIAFTPGSASMGRVRRGPLLVIHELGLLGLHLADQLLVRGGLDDLVELGPVVRDEADALDDHVVDEPAVAVPVHLVLDRDLGAVLGGDAGADRGLIAVDGVAEVGDLLAAVELDLRQVRALEQVGEEVHELPALAGRARLPVTSQRALGRLGEVEDVLGDLPDGRPPLPALAFLLEIGLLQRLHDPVDLNAQQVGRRPRPPLAHGDQTRHQRGRDQSAAPKRNHPNPPLPQTLPKMYLEINSSRSMGASTSRMRPLGGMILSEPPGLIRMYFSPIKPLVLIEAIESS